jgi:DNA ligase-1
MPTLTDGQSTEMQGSGKKPYTLKNSGGVYSCSCPAWRNQSFPIESRTCKHLRKYLGEDVEAARVGVQAKPARKTKGPEKTPPPVLLAHSWKNDIDLKGWWMSEKLDGVRAWWTGKKFLSRLGNTFEAPDWFVEDFPKHTLDGELWMGRKMFQKTSGVVRRKDKSDGWEDVRYLMFDSPGHGLSFEHRMKSLLELDKSHFVHFGGSLMMKYAKVHKHVKCKGLKHLTLALAKVEGLGGEGLMLREPGSLYEAGRSHTLLKVKTFHDAEATVTDYVAGKGRHRGRMGAVWVATEDGVEFKVGTGWSDKQRENPPAIGQSLTYRYQELTDDGKPRFPSFVRLHEEF